MGGAYPSTAINNDLSTILIPIYPKHLVNIDY